MFKIQNFDLEKLIDPKLGFELGLRISKFRFLTKFEIWPNFKFCWSKWFSMRLCDLSKISKIEFFYKILVRGDEPILVISKFCIRLPNFEAHKVRRLVRPSAAAQISPQFTVILLILWPPHCKVMIMPREPQK